MGGIVFRCDLELLNCFVSLLLEIIEVSLIAIDAVFEVLAACGANGVDPVPKLDR